MSMYSFLFIAKEKYDVLFDLLEKGANLSNVNEISVNDCNTKVAVTWTLIQYNLIIQDQEFNLMTLTPPDQGNVNNKDFWNKHNLKSTIGDITAISNSVSFIVAVHWGGIDEKSKMRAVCDTKRERITVNGQNYIGSCPFTFYTGNTISELLSDYTIDESRKISQFLTIIEGDIVFEDTTQSSNVQPTITKKKQPYNTLMQYCLNSIFEVKQDVLFLSYPHVVTDRTIPRNEIEKIVSKLKHVSKQIGVKQELAPFESELDKLCNLLSSFAIQCDMEALNKFRNEIDLVLSELINHNEFVVHKISKIYI